MFLNGNGPCHENHSLDTLYCFHLWGTCNTKNLSVSAQYLRLFFEGNASSLFLSASSRRQQLASILSSDATFFHQLTHKQASFILLIFSRSFWIFNSYSCWKIQMFQSEGVPTESASPTCWVNSGSCRDTKAWWPPSDFATATGVFVYNEKCSKLSHLSSCKSSDGSPAGAADLKGLNNYPICRFIFCRFTNYSGT